MSNPTRRQFPFHEIEPKWQIYWDEKKIFRAANPGESGSEKPKYYILDMFPYPSGNGLHVGHPEGYTATDILARYKRMKGFNVLHPMGWDAFGLPAEQYAIQTGTHPKITTEKNIATFKRQIKSLGFSYDWSREVDTTDPKYFKWTQWIFMQLYRKGLAYVSEAPVWYCPGLGTVLANEEVLATDEGPRSERGHFPVERRPLRQWMLRITAYAERLLNDLDSLDWPESLKEMQRNWIGRSEGAEVEFLIPDSDARITVFTTRPDTLFGATYMVLAPEHPLLKSIVTEDRRKDVTEYQTMISARSDLERTDLSKEKTGCFTGAYAINPVNNEKIPVWIADYVLMSYGTGAIMSVPAHDERDHEFAVAFNLPIVEVVQPPDKPCAQGSVYAGDGTAIHSGFLDGLSTADAKARMIEWIEQQGVGTRKVQYKLRDWLFSRQRYWGEPFPVIWKDGRHGLIEESDLPLTLPELEDYRPGGDGMAPLSKAEGWLNLPGGARRETNTMPQWAGSCWYYLRYMDPDNDLAPVGKDVEKYWMGENGVDLYVGGAEHAVLHLLYARFWHKVLFDIGIVSTREPFHKLVNQGLILGEDGQKMSKSRGNVVNPDDVVSEYGADSLRLFEMFMGPLEQVKPWSTKGVEGVYRFLGRVWRLVMTENQEGKWQINPALSDHPPDAALNKLVHQSIRKVTEDIESMSFNTAISQLMVLTNDLTKSQVKSKAAIGILIRLLAPFAPHLAEELWSQLGHQTSINREAWPEMDSSALVEDEVEIIIQVNGKLKGRMSVPANLSRDEYEAKARALKAFDKWIDGKTVRKVIAVPGKLLNVVVA